MEDVRLVDMVTVNFVRRFVAGRLGGVAKDLAICMEPIRNDLATSIGARKGTRAYLPALMTCCGLLELIGALYLGPPPKGKSAGFGPRALKSIAAAGFLPAGHYPETAIDALWKIFRHKIAHRTHPQLVTEIGDALYAWTVTEEGLGQAINLQKIAGRAYITSHDTPWPVPYTATVVVSIPKLHVDGVRAAHAYLDALADTSHRDHDERIKSATNCIKEFMPPATSKRE